MKMCQGKPCFLFPPVLAARVVGRLEYSQPSVDYGAMPRTDTAIIRRVCAEAKAMLAVARGDGGYRKNTDYA